MNIVFICTNYNSIKCGIGMYTFNLVQEFEKIKDINIEIIEENTFEFSKIKRFFNINILKKIIKYINKNKENKKQKLNFIIEYPFMDWSFFNLIGIFLLKKYFKNSILILSIHEYDRVSYFRKKATEFLMKISDKFIITDENLKKILPNKEILLREIPSNIKKVNLLKPVIKLENNYCFFGLINKAKAFDEMLEAWKKFNLSKNYILNIYTSSNIEVKSLEEYNIKVFKDLNNEELSIELQKNSFMLLPILPNINSNNGTLKAAATHGCIPIGIFSNSINFLGVNILDKKYTIQNIEKALEETLKINKKEEISKLKKYSINFSFENNSKKIYKNLLRGE